MIADVKGVTDVRRLTLPEVADTLRMSVHTLRTPAWLTRLEAVKVAGRYLVAPEVVTEVLTGKR